jgi:hypothetical protein
MGRAILLALACLAVAACTTTKSHTFTGTVEPPPAQSVILLVQPDIELSVLTTAGLPEPRADWSQSARTNVATALRAKIAGEGHSAQDFDTSAAMDGRIGQIVRLHEAVGTSILAFNYGFINLPTKRDNFDWTLGPGAREIAAAHNARYALFVYARGTYSSAGRIVMALLFGGPTGVQQMFASLVDLQTGNIIWFNVATAGPNADMREPDGARALVDSLMQDSPL